MIRQLIFVGIFAANLATAVSLPSTGNAKPIHITEPLLIVMQQ